MSLSKVISISSTGFAGLEKQLEKHIKRSVIGVAQAAVNSGAEDLAFVAREMAPVRTGSLERAIQPFVRKRVDGTVAYAGVRIDPLAYSVMNKRYVREYAEEAHNQITPYGHKQLGPLSVMKNQTSPYHFDNVGVGGGFLDRAVEYMQDRIQNDVRDAVNSVIKSYRKK